MRRHLLPLLAAFAALAGGGVLAQQPSYPLTDDSKPQPGVPKGEVLKFSFEKSRIFPGTVRDCWVYVPAQYRPEKPACLYVNQDGVQWQAPVVFDNLIHKGEMPVTIGVFVMHGRVPAESEAAQSRYNRSLEYDGLGDRYARFLVEELLPEVERMKAGDGRPIRLSKRAADRAIGGSSSGAVCAFTAAWERPDQFSRVWSTIGTYVGLRGADRYPTLVRKYEPRPIRLFLQDGSNDLNIYAGDWWMANQMMLRALEFSGYEVKHVWGEGGHNGQHGTALFPDAMRWLWNGWPAPVGGGRSRNDYIRDLLEPGQHWEARPAEVGPAGLAASVAGDIRYAAKADGSIRATNSERRGGASRIEALAGGPEGNLYYLRQGVLYREPAGGGRARRVASGIPGKSLVVAHDGTVYVAAPGKIWRISPGGEKKSCDSGVQAPGGITLSPDQTFLLVADRKTQWIHSYQIVSGGDIRHGQRYGWLHLSDEDGGSEAGGMAVDPIGRLYVATELGVQVLDQPGRVHCIIPVPGGAVTGLAWGGSDMKTLYASSGGRLYSRRLRVAGRQSWQPPNKPPTPGL